MQQSHFSRRLPVIVVKPSTSVLALRVNAVQHEWLHSQKKSALQERTYEHQPQPLGNKPVTLGQGYSTIAWIPETEGSWVLPLLHERITSFEKPVDKAAIQWRLVAEQVSNRVSFLGDSEYACAPFINQTADIDCDKLLRLRPNGVLYYPPSEEYSGVGRPTLHGQKFSLKDSQTWGDWQEELYVVDPKLGNLRVRMWQDLHLTGAADKPVRLILVAILRGNGFRAAIEPQLSQYFLDWWVAERLIYSVLTRIPQT
jgi:hypothetical protein